MLALTALLAALAFPAADPTAWMRPEAFHLTIGMSRSETVAKLEMAGLKAEKGDDERHMVVDYTPTQSLTLEFSKDRLRSIRFELYLPSDKIGSAFEREKQYLSETFGEPKSVTSRTMVIYDTTLPNVMAVVTRGNSSRTLSTLVVRYFDPAGK